MLWFSGSWFCLSSLSWSWSHTVLILFLLEWIHSTQHISDVVKLKCISNFITKVFHKYGQLRTSPFRFSYEISSLLSHPENRLKQFSTLIETKDTFQTAFPKFCQCRGKGLWDLFEIISCVNPRIFGLNLDSQTYSPVHKTMTIIIWCSSEYYECIFPFSASYYCHDKVPKI